ncbi:hypothetical protein BDY21DRAFT_183403 [Lineolata rhizophorae]|uniref:Uncharacterized protein n=1 Tax=Lineolata rhizophorae TaxID=578093 RepID=A0A6A6P859_9PEZI|nr:hypothetical protein BDY21DRAFT_183403 [Lineolata rhizophorae]
MRSSKDRTGRLIDLSASVNQLCRASQLRHHLGDKIPRASTCSEVMSSYMARKPSNKDF